jgi:flagellar hook-basal body complex protein FliE
MSISPIGSVGINIVKDIGASSKSSGITDNIGKSDQPEKSFMSTVMDSLKSIQQNQSDANTQISQIASGQGSDLAGVLITAEKASLEMQFTLAIRNKLVESYQEIIRMQV